MLDYDDNLYVYENEQVRKGLTFQGILWAYTHVHSSNWHPLMDDFAPMEEFGPGTCVALAHARRLFAHCELFPSEGLIFGGAVHPEAPRGMIFLADRRGEIAIQRWPLPLWRVAGFLLERCFSPRFFPARVR